MLKALLLELAFMAGETDRNYLDSQLHRLLRGLLLFL